MPNRRDVVAGALASATLAGEAWAALPPLTADRTRVIFISDIHIGDGSPTVWYQPDFHEPFLTALFDHVIGEASSIRELVILGDFVDFWTYAPSRRPPRFRDIALANPAIFGARGKLVQALSALKGRVSYVPGNHDMSVTQADLDPIVSQEGYRVRVIRDEVYFPLAPDRRLACAHGHRWTMFNAPDLSTPLAPLPFGHFVTRSVAHMMARDLPPGRSVADLPDQGAPNGIELSQLAGVIASTMKESLVDAAVGYSSKLTGLAVDAPILLPAGQITTLAEVRQIYRTLWPRWQAEEGGGLIGQQGAAKAAYADVNGTYLPWFAQRLALRYGADLVVFGHTHEARTGLKEGFVDYVNTGFDCPSRADIGRKHPTFIEVDGVSLKAELKQVTARADGRYVIEPFAQPQLDKIVYGTTQDFSCYVTIDNRAGAADLTRLSAEASHGRFVVEPPTIVRRGEVARFWVQDHFGARGSDAQAVYAGGGRRITLSMTCPTGVLPNQASGLPVEGKTGDGAYADAVPRFGHPLFVRFTA